MVLKYQNKNPHQTTLYSCTLHATISYHIISFSLSIFIQLSTSVTTHFSPIITSASYKSLFTNFSLFALLRSETPTGQ
ncbi:hypothetical protein Hanom_Chr17g01552531 [Helianthus anomalus]